MESSTSSTHWRSIIALAGPPGSGKSTVATQVAQRLNQGHEDAPMAKVIPIDGFHFPRSVLDTFPDPVLAHARRGAAWTFDASGVVALFEALRATQLAPPLEAPTIRAPSFDHAVKDPVADRIVVPPSATIIILEGNWLLYDKEPWRRLASLVDETWFIDVEPSVAELRVARRHLQSGIEGTWEAALKRARENDSVNGMEVREKLIRPDVVVESVEARD